MELGVSGGLSYYLGDINPGRQFNQADLGLGATVRYYRGTRWAFRFSYTYMSLKGDDDVRKFIPEREASFTSKVNDFSVVAEFNFFEYWTGSRRCFVTPYIFGGLSVFVYDSDWEHKNSQYILEEDVSDKKNGVSGSIPFGVGVKYSVSRKIGLTFEWRMHKTFTDKIDGITKESLYEDDSSLSGRLTKFRDFDWFSYAGVTISYKFVLPQSKKCNIGMNEKYYRYN